ncbi:MAG: NAD-dependent epimerase/dehydratase family protein [Clostridiales bacterium]|nr:NAD-dependent epimerase/dehydratase family protein [Clostridiales bacterium]
MVKKRVLITGANSYIGTSVEKYVLENYPEDCSFDTIDLKDAAWREKDFTGYDAVFHVAGIAHSDSGKISAEKEKLYRSVNTDLTVEVANKAKTDGVKQFVFMSSAIVYGDSSKVGGKKNITNDTPVSPANCYGDSKVQAENGILPLADDNFKVCILRPPMIFGKGCKGNYQTLRKLALKLKLFPYVKNERSMIHIDNFCEFVRLMIVNEECGIFFPQNIEYSNTSEMVKMIAAAHGKKLHLIHGFGWAIKFMGLFIGIAKKAFGSLTYDKVISTYKEDYIVADIEESIRRTENE